MLKPNKIIKIRKSNGEIISAKILHVHRDHVIVNWSEKNFRCTKKVYLSEIVIQNQFGDSFTSKLVLIILLILVFFFTVLLVDGVIYSYEESQKANFK